MIHLHTWFSASCGIFIWGSLICQPAQVAAQAALAPEETAMAYADSAQKYAYDSKTALFQGYAEKALAEGNAANCTICVANTTWAMGTNEFERGYMLPAHRYYAQALLLYETLQDARNTALCLAGMVRCDLQMGRNAHTEAHIIRATAAIKGLQDTLAMATILSCVGSYYHDKQDLVQASTYFQQVLAIMHKEGQPAEKSLYARTLCDLAVVQYQSGMHDEAVKSSMEALRFAREHDIEAVMSHINTQVAFIYQDKKDPEKALMYVNRAIQTDSTDNKQANLALRYLIKGNILVQMEQPQQALAYYGIAVQISKMLHLARLQATCYTQLLETHTLLGNSEQAGIYTQLIQALEAEAQTDDGE